MHNVYATLNSFNLATNTIIRNRLGHMALSKYLNMFECGMNYGEEPKAIDHHDAIYPPLSLEHSNLIEVLKMRSKSLVQSTAFEESTLMHSVNLIQRGSTENESLFRPNQHTTANNTTSYQRRFLPVPATQEHGFYVQYHLDFIWRTSSSTDHMA
eukprot:1079834_1